MALVLAAAVIAGVGIGGYALGEDAAPTEAEGEAAFAAAKEATMEPAEREAFEEARDEAYKKGVELGTRKGKRQGVAKAASEDATGTAKDTVTDDADTPPGLGPLGCGGDPYAVPDPDGGCIRPAHPPSPPILKNCPPGQVRVGVTGACAPRD